MEKLFYDYINVSLVDNSIMNMMIPHYFAEWMLNRMGKFTPNFLRVYGRSIEAMDFPIPGRTFISKRSTHNLRADTELKSVSLHHIIREKGKKYAEKITAYDRMFKDSDYAPMPDKVKEYVHLVREASIDEIRKWDVILCTTAVGSNPKVLQATSVHQVGYWKFEIILILSF